MQKLKTERGITLIALIITIIVMLILVGVTVSVSLNGGLFTTAQQAKNKTQLEIDKEQLLELALGAMDNKGEITPSEITKDGRFEYDEENKIYESESGNKFTVSKWGSVSIAPELSGKWSFASELDVGDIENPMLLRQNISFLVNYNASDESSGESWSAYRRFESIQIGKEGYWPGSEEYYYTPAVSYQGTQVYGINWVSVVDDYPVTYRYYYRNVDFGSEPQTVSQEFYDWFIANAEPVEE